MYSLCTGIVCGGVCLRYCNISTVVRSEHCSALSPIARGGSCGRVGAQTRPRKVKKWESEKNRLKN